MSPVASIYYLKGDRSDFSHRPVVKQPLQIPKSALAPRVNPKPLTIHNPSVPRVFTILLNGLSLNPSSKVRKYSHSGHDHSMGPGDRQKGTEYECSLA